jgi:hypothetical protein
MVKQNWGDEPCCPRCGDTDVYRMMSGEQRNKDFRWRCNGCKKMFTGGLIDEDCRTETPPSAATKQKAMNLLLSIPYRYLGNLEIGAFCGEIHFQWVSGNRQVIVMCFPNRTPLLHHSARLPDAPKEHGMEAASAERIVTWLEWLQS